jgi:hypothetical protein
MAVAAVAAVVVAVAVGCEQASQHNTNTTKQTTKLGNG